MKYAIEKNRAYFIKSDFGARRPLSQIPNTLDNLYLALEDQESACYLLMKFFIETIISN